MNKQQIFLVFLLVFSLLPVYGSIKFVDNGRAEHSFIVLDMTPSSPAAQYAAQELSYYIEKITGLDLKFETGIGKNNMNIVLGYGELAKRAGLTLDGLAHDGFKLVTKDNTLFIFGMDRPDNRPIMGGNHIMKIIHTYNSKLDISRFGDAGTLHGMYYFLREYLGVRWYMPGPDGEHIPRASSITIPELNLTVNPAFEFRYAHIGLPNHDHEMMRWYARAGFGAPAPVEICHSFFFLNKYQKEHPEWFALLKDGRRDFNITCEERGNLCLSQPGVLEAFVKEARDYFDAYPYSDYFSVMPNDWFNQICECETCQAQAEYDKEIYGQFSNYVWNFVNNVAKEVGKTHPGKFIACCAYNTYMLIPDKVKLEPNVVVEFCKCVNYRFDDFYRQRNDELALQWAAHVKNLYIWDYYCWDMTSRHLSGLPIIFSQWMEMDFRNLAGKSKGYMIEGNIEPPLWTMRNPWLNYINFYLAGRFMWDPSLNAKDLMNDFCTNFYGPAKEPMARFWQRAEELWTNMDVKLRGAGDNLNGTLYTKEVLAELQGYMEAAKATVPADSVYARRLAGLEKEFYPYVKKVTNVNDAIPSTVVSRTTQQPVIDGVREELWDTAVPLPFVEQATGGESAVSTTAWMLHDDDNLYVFFQCMEPRPDNLTANCDVNDSNKGAPIWEDDDVEIFISPDSRKISAMAHIIVNPKGFWWDACHGSKVIPEVECTKFNTGMTCKVVKGQDRWCVEIAIPKAGLTIDANQPYGQWRMNLCRNAWISEIDSKSREFFGWSATLSHLWRVPERFGYVRFE